MIKVIKPKIKKKKMFCKLKITFGKRSHYEKLIFIEIIIILTTKF